MKKKLLFSTMLQFIFIGSIFAGQKYNPFENRWETVPNDWVTKYNAFENDWSYQPEDSHVEYNPFENSWDWDSGNN